MLGDTKTRDDDNEQINSEENEVKGGCPEYHDSNAYCRQKCTKKTGHKGKHKCSGNHTWS